MSEVNSVSYGETERPQMRVVKDRYSLKQVSAGRPSAHIPIPCIYLTWRDKHLWDGDKFGTRDKLEALKSENPGAPVYAEGKEGSIESFAGLTEIGGQNGVA